MKLTKALLITLSLFLTFSLIGCRVTKKTETNKASKWIRPLIKTARSYLSFANLAYCKPEIINALSCPLCHQILDQSFKLAKYDRKETEGRVYQFVAMVSETHKEIVISFSGPKTSDAHFYGKIYQSGFRKIHGESVENAFLDVYSSTIEHTLQEFIQTYIAQHPQVQEYKFIFLGHSFGGSIAVLAAYDLVQKGIIKSNSSLNSPLVYSYGQLRVGNDKFVEKVNSLFKVIRIVKSSDPMTRLPNCTYSEALGKWRCFRDTYNLFLRYPEYRRYITDYSGKAAFNSYKTHSQGVKSHYSRSFLERSAKSLRRKKGYYYSANNPGYKTYSYGSNLVNQGSKSYGNVYYSQPLGSEVLFSNNFKKFTVCNYFKGIPDCEKQLPKTFDSSHRATYYGADVEDC
jgi:hypothetical protein